MRERWFFLVLPTPLEPRMPTKRVLGPPGATSLSVETSHFNWLSDPGILERNSQVEG